MHNTTQHNAAVNFPAVNLHHMAHLPGGPRELRGNWAGQAA
jgi:hypothetical protein